MSSRKKAADESKESSAPETGTISFSTRLTQEERDRIEKAAELKGWKPANLVRVAALERSAHILNTSTRTKIDFAGIAATVARQLAAPSATLVDLQTGEPLDAEAELEYGGSVDAEAHALSYAQIEELRKAAQYGGLEFLNMIINRCEELVARSGYLPDPVEPS